MLGLLDYIFSCSWALKLIKGGVNLTKSLDPVSLAKNITLTVVDCCSPSQLRLAFHCIAAGAVIGASIVGLNSTIIDAAVAI